jgi:LPS-assembly protein
MRLSPIAFLLFCAAAPQAFADDAGLTLQLDRAFTSIAGRGMEETPVFISAERLEGKKNSQIEAQGNVELRKPGQLIVADRVLLLQDSKELTATGAVRIEQDNNVIRGTHLEYNLNSGSGDMTQPRFQFGDNHARGEADTLHMAGRENYALQNVSYTTCPAHDDDWLLKVRELDIDRASQIGTAHDARVEFMGVPILYTPWMDFSLNSGRKSGFLAPTFGSTVTGGTDLTLPYYWNISPNLDATIAPRFIAKRGNMLNDEVRYLEPAYSGEAHVDVLPNDRLEGSTRSFMSLNHRQNFGYGLNGTVHVERVSDSTYFDDLSDSVNLTSQTNLLREGLLSYGGGWWNAAARVQSFQTLQDPLAPVVVPYRRLPQFSLGVLRTVDRATVSLAAEYTDFHHPTYVDGRRLLLYPSVSYPLIASPAFYLTPKIGLHSSYYSMGDNNTGNLPNASRTLPIFSLDSGMTLERDTRLRGHDYVQTLEPRAYYVYIPYRNQSLLPLFDTALSDFTFTQIFAENRFLGSDRIGDANQVTAALTSRLIEPDSGVERLRVAIGQRFSAISPQVNLVEPASANMAPPTQPNSPPNVTNKSDILLGVFGQMTRVWSLDSTFQYNPSQKQSDLFNTALRYQPEIGKVINLGYRFTRDEIRQVDMSAQWPLSTHWHGVARWNYSLLDGRILEALTGLEYNQRCWALRLVAQRFVTATQLTSSGLFVQLELNDMVAVGSDPLGLLRQSVPGYTKMNGSAGNAPLPIQ